MAAVLMLFVLLSSIHENLSADTPTDPNLTTLLKVLSLENGPTEVQYPQLFCWQELPTRLEANDQIYLKHLELKQELRRNPVHAGSITRTKEVMKKCLNEEIELRDMIKMDDKTVSELQSSLKLLILGSDIRSPFDVYYNMVIYAANPTDGLEAITKDSQIDTLWNKISSQLRDAMQHTTATNTNTGTTATKTNAPTNAQTEAAKQKKSTEENGKYTFEKFLSFDALDKSHPNAEKWVTINTKEIDSECDMTIHVFGNLKDLPIEDVILAANATKLCPDLHLLLKALKNSGAEVNTGQETEESSQVLPNNMVIYVGNPEDGLEVVTEEMAKQNVGIVKWFDKMWTRLTNDRRGTVSGFAFPESGSQNAAITTLVKVLPSEKKRLFPQFLCWHESNGQVLLERIEPDRDIIMKYMRMCLHGDIATGTNMDQAAVRQLKTYLKTMVFVE